jgi:hypothetical protein
VTAADRHALYSSQREEYVEYAFLGALCAEGWRRHRYMEVVRASTDAYGYDLILSEGVGHAACATQSDADGR